MSTLVALQNVDNFDHVLETDTVSIHTTDLALVNWSWEDLVVCSVPTPDHLTFLLPICSPVRGPQFIAGLGHWPYPKSSLKHIGQYHVHGQTILTYSWWWCLIAWLLPGGYDPRTKVVGGHIQTPPRLTTPPQCCSAIRLPSAKPTILWLGTSKTWETVIFTMKICQRLVSLLNQLLKVANW